MAISGFGRDKRGAATGSNGGGSSSSSGGGLGNLTAFIDQGSEFEGKLSFKDTVRIDGKFTGEISSDNTLIVGECGEINATVYSQNVLISGFVEGDIKAEQKIVLHKTAVVNGNIESPTVLMEEGAQLNGNVRMGQGAEARSGAGGASSAGDAAQASGGGED